MRENRGGRWTAGRERKRLVEVQVVRESGRKWGKCEGEWERGMMVGRSESDGVRGGDSGRRTGKDQRREKERGG